MKVRVLIFGTGPNAEKLKRCLKQDAEIVAYADNDSLKWNTVMDGKRVIAPQDILNEQFDFVVAAVARYEDVVRQLAALGVPEEKIAAPLAFDHARHEDFRAFFHIEELIYLEMNQKLEALGTYVSSLEYELAAKIRDQKIRYPKILPAESAVEEIIRHHKSMSRFGDGEFDLMLGRNNCFQGCSAALAGRLQEVLKSSLENHIVAIPDAYGYFENRTQEFISCFRNHLKDGRREQEYGMIDMEKEYYDSFITRPYKDYVDKSVAGSRFALLKTVWQGRDLTIVEGRKTRLGVGNDLFEGARSRMRILGPERDAFLKYEQIMEAVLKTDPGRLVLIAMGPTATVLAYDLAKMGYQALDIGHIDIEYEWYLRGLSRMTAVEGKYVSEVPGGNNVPEQIADESYNREITDIIE